MSLCKGRLYFETKSERRSQDSFVAQTLNLDDSDSEVLEDGGTDMDASNVSQRFTSLNKTPGVGLRPDLWDSGLGSPTPGSPRTRNNRTPTKSMLSMSPIPLCCQFDSDEEDQGLVMKMPPCPPTPYTPPHKKFRSLRLYDTPHTPKSLLQKAQRRTQRINRTVALTLSSDNDSDIPDIPMESSPALMDSGKVYGDKDSVKMVLDPDGPQTNVNPFSSDDKLQKRCCSITAHGIKRARNHLDSAGYESIAEEGEDDVPVPPSCKRLALHEINTSRYNEEFHEVCKLGDGEFGSVYKCINRLDGCTYAVKKSKTPVAGSVYERNALNEVYAHAVLGKHQHVVRYYSAWAENDHMYIQNEFCNGSSLADVIAENNREGQRLSETELKQLLLQVAQGLKFVHVQNLVHLDVKPGNIFMHRPPAANCAESGVEEDISEAADEDCDLSGGVTYKIGDLGHVTSVSQPQVEEGDCRYLPNEILQEKFDHLAKADVFSLALTVFEAGGAGDLPKNGPWWHAIRSGDLSPLEHCSPEFNNLHKSMVHPVPTERPSASAVIQSPVLCPFAKKSRAQLRKELNAEKFKNEMLSRQLLEAKQTQSPVAKPQPQPPAGKSSKTSRLIGKAFKRSMSVSCF